MTSYQILYNSAVVNSAKLPLVDGIISKIIANKDRYKSVADTFPPMPYWAVAVIHNMECSLNFKCHLHNGDPLTAKTVHVPAGRPKTGTPPFQWEDSAIDALKYQGFNVIKDWGIANLLKELEFYNGSGYRKRGINTPYLWSATNHYGTAPNIGKYVTDGKFDSSAISQQIGAAAIIKRMDEKGLL